MARQLRWHEIRRRRKARAGKNSFPPTPLPFCPPERSGFAREGRLYFLDLEKKRRMYADLRKKLIVLDRSFLSVLAFHFAVEKTSAGKVICFSESLQAISGEEWIFPDLCIYLDVDDLEIKKRHETERGLYDPILLDSVFNFQLRRFYDDILPSIFPMIKVAKIDVSLSFNEVLSNAKSLLEK